MVIGSEAGLYWIKAIYGRIQDHRVGLIAAGIAFYGLLALFPAISALLAVGGLVLEPEQIVSQLRMAGDIIPDDAMTIIMRQAEAVSTSRGLGWALLISLGFSIWSASRGVANLVAGLNIAYDVEESRGFLKLNMQLVILTLLLILGVACAIGLIILLPIMLNFIDWGLAGEWIIGASRWVILAVIAIAGLSLTYSYGPSRRTFNWCFMSAGSIVACVGWVCASYGFTLYVKHFGSYNESFGTLAGVIILLMWLWIAAYIVLLGAEVNAEIEARSSSDEALS